MKCERAQCPHRAAWLVRISFLSGRRIVSYLCGHHGDALYLGLMAKPQTRSGSRTPLAGVKELAA